MYCDQCGTKLEENVNFCRACGHPVVGAPALPREESVAGHLRLLGILWIAISAFRLLPAVTLFSIGGLLQFPPFMRALLPAIGLTFLVAAVLGFVAGWGLLERAPWARTLSIVLGIIALVDVPLGTALGIYTLWVLLPLRPGIPGVQAENSPLVRSER
ncbi:MAG TPA: zinc ribbon domain-containing protein [Bryobacteraceae bacterium]|nr:zinc ribbon domain-containing protein [Bryobacteraceae bacterium]